MNSHDSLEEETEGRERREKRVNELWARWRSTGEVSRVSNERWIWIKSDNKSQEVRAR
jgi:hypothetical protein